MCKAWAGRSQCLAVPQAPDGPSECAWKGEQRSSTFLEPVSCSGAHRAQEHEWARARGALRPPWPQDAPDSCQGGSTQRLCMALGVRADRNLFPGEGSSCSRTKCNVCNPLNLWFGGYPPKGSNLIMDIKIPTIQPCCSEIFP